MRRLLCLLLSSVLLITAAGSVLAQSAPANLFEDFVQKVRLDMELLADSVYGAGVRPESWTGNTVLNSPTVVADLWFDNEQLADLILAGVRPDNWIGATSSNAQLVARNVRHDLELLADTRYGFDNRPDGWIGAAAIYRCERTLQNMLYLLGVLYNVSSRTPEAVINYCQAVLAEVEDELLSRVFASAELQEALPELILAIRGDIERVANEVYGAHDRPPAWIGNREITSPTLVSDNFADLELLATDIMGSSQRPEGWIGLISSSMAVSYRNLRHDLELLATEKFGPTERPRGWQGEDPLVTCTPLVQNLVLLVQQNYGFTYDTEDVSPNFCTQVERSANLLAENPPTVEIVEEEDTRFRYLSERAFAYLDQAALQYMGVMPWGTEFRAWYRNFNESNMMFVSGLDFAVYIDRRWTNMPREIFEQLPTLDGVRPLTFCDANWCNGPAPTPTPTGRGPLYDVIFAATPPATVAAGDVAQQGKQLVSWNHIRVNYLFQRPELRLVQVTLEICQDVNQIACEPVTSVFNNSTGTSVPVVSQFNGMNVYEMPYGYQTNLVIEGATLFATDLWLNDPTLLTPIAPTATVPGP